MHGAHQPSTRLTRHVRAQFVPFIQGPRNCLGQYFALLEARIVLALLVKVGQPLAIFTSLPVHLLARELI